MRILSFFYTIFFIFLSTIGYSWSDAGHRYSGIVAYQNLPKDISNKVIEDVKKHPHFDAHFTALMPENVKIADKNIQNAWIFSQMAVWPDIIKGKELNYSPQNRNWHYINLPVFLTPTDERFYAFGLPNNVERMYTDITPESWNISQAFFYNNYLIDSSSISTEKAIALCWIFHLIGDIHQPLHATALFNETRFPKGDLGGNAIAIKGMGSLHTTWDRANFVKGSKEWTFEQHIIYCDSLEKAVLNPSNFDKSIAFEKWINESHDLALKVVYIPELLAKIKEAPIEKYGFSNNLTVNFEKDFVKEIKKQIIETSNRRVVEAGLRIAAYLEEKYGEE